MSERGGGREGCVSRGLDLDELIPAGGVTNRIPAMFIPS